MWLLILQEVELLFASLIELQTGCDRYQAMLLLNEGGLRTEMTRCKRPVSVLLILTH